MEYAKKDAKDTALDDAEDVKAATAAVKAIAPTTFGECTDAGLKYTFVAEADAKYADFQAHNTCRLDKIFIFSDKECKNEIKDAKKTKTALKAAQDWFGKLLMDHQKDACDGTGDKVATCDPGKTITVTEYEDKAAKDGDTPAIVKCTKAKTDPAPKVWTFDKCNAAESNIKTAVSDVKAYKFEHDTSLDQGASFLKAGAAALLAFAATQF